MANEKRGILFEVITEYALQKAVKLAGIPGEVRWNEKPKGMSIVPDFTIGEDKDQPSHIILVTASGAEHNSHMKMWRNQGEFQEIKSQLPTIPNVVCIYGKSVVKKGLNEVTEALFDATIHLENCEYHQDIDEWVKKHSNSKFSSQSEKRNSLLSEIPKNKILYDALNKFSQDLSKILSSENSDFKSLWSLMKEDYLKSHKPPKVKTTSVRRGIGKLLVIEPEIRQVIYQHYNQNTLIQLENAPSYLCDLGFFEKSLGGYRLQDQEIIEAIKLLGEDTCEAVITQAPNSMKTWITPLRELDRVAVHVNFIYENYDKVTEAKEFKKILVDCFKNPSCLSGVESDEKVWVFEIMISLLKAQTGKKQGYGLSQLSVDTKTPEFSEGGFIIPPFTQCQKMLSKSHLESLSEGFSQKFKTDISRSDVLALKEKVVDWVIKENLEDRLIPYRNFEPLLWLLETELKKQGKSYEPKRAYTGWINEYAQVGKSSATTPFVRVGKTLIHWKSSYKSHVNDKTKELSGRARSIKYQYHPTNKIFTRRADVEKLALIIDGDWKERHLETLSKSGWDIIVYPDQIAELVSQL